MVAPVVVAMFTPIPLWIAIAVLEVRRRLSGGEKKEKMVVETKELSEDLLVTTLNGDVTRHNGVGAQHAVPSNGDVT